MRILDSLQIELKQRLEARAIDAAEDDGVRVTPMSDDKRERLVNEALDRLIEVWGADIFASAKPRANSHLHFDAE